MTIKLDGVHKLTTADFVAVATQDAPLHYGPHALHPATHVDRASLALA